MRYIRLGRTNAEVSAVSLGTWGYSGPREVNGTAVGWSGHDDELARRAMIRAWESGINHWDTADVYGDGRSESLIGSMWETVPRDEIFLATKVGWDPGAFGHYYHPELIRDRVVRSLLNLRTDVIDLYYLHHCDFGPNGDYFDDAIAVLRSLRDEGSVRFIGMSDWDSAKIMRFIDRAEPDVVQPYRNVVDDTYESSGLRGWIEKHDAGVAFFSPLMHGLLLGKYDAPTEFPEGDFRRRIEQFRDPEFIARMKRARGAMESRFPEHPSPVLHAIVGAILSDAPTGCALLGQRNPDQVQAAASVGDALDAETASWVRSVYRGET